MTNKECALIAAISLAFCGCVDDVTEPGQDTPRLRGDASTDSVTPNAFAPTPPPTPGMPDCGGGAQPTYHGGLLMTTPKIVLVYWDRYGGPYPSIWALPIESFFRHIIKSPYVDMLGEYSTSGYTLGQGTFDGSYWITPSHSSTNLSALDINSELDSQASAGHLPASTSNTIYVVVMPPSTLVTDFDGNVQRDSSQPGCPGDFIAFHAHAYLNYSHPLTYRHFIVLPDYTGPFGADCNELGTVTALDRLTSAASHELAETITDPEGDGWYTGSSSCEIGDMCENHNDVKYDVHEMHERSYQVQTEWSKDYNECISRKVTPTSDVVWRNSSSLIVGEMATSGGLLQWGPTLQLGSQWTVAGSGDVDADGYADIVLRNPSTGDNAIWFMAHGTFIRNMAIPEATTDWVIRAIGDLDGDGLSDIVEQNTVTNDTYWWRLGPTGWPISYADLGNSNGWTLRGAGDFNHDGRSDLFFTLQTSSGVQTWISYMNGSAVVGAAQVATKALGYSFAGIGDMNGDGFSDVFWARNTGVVVASLNTESYHDTVGAPSSAITTVDNVIGSYVSGWSISTVSDMNGDGFSDIVDHNANTGEAYTWLLVPGGYYGAASAGTRTTDFSIVTSAGMD
jgi:hypothetical protein